MSAENTFEFTARVDERAPDDYREWPEPFRKASDFSIAKLLSDNPGAKVINETSSCIDETDSRFPDGDENKGKFWVIRTVEIERSAPSQSGAHEALTVAVAQSLLQIANMIGAKEARAKLKKALNEFGPEHMPEAYRDAPVVEERQHGDEQPE